MRQVGTQYEPRTVGLLLGLTILVAVVLLFTFLQWPQIKGYRTALESRQQLALNIRDNDQLVNQLNSEQTAVEALKRRLHGDMAGLPMEQMESYVIGRLQKLSWEAGVELISVRPKEGRQVEIFREILFDVEVNGRYFDFFKWLRSVGSELGFVVVKRFEIHPLSTLGQDPELHVSLSMAAYRVER